jgi:hypothetical protein
LGGNLERRDETRGFDGVFGENFTSFGGLDRKIGCRKI